MEILRKIKRALDDGGLSVLFKRALRLCYRKLEPFLPQCYGRYQELKVPSHKPLETLIDFTEKNRPNYEEGLISSLEENVKEGDEILILGGGLGVTAAKAAKLCGNTSNIKVFEASRDQISKMEKTFEKNNVTGIEITHAIVGEEVDIWGSSKKAKQVKPEDLPPCDILEIDIEGSETEVLRNLEIRPRVIIVETHGFKGAPTKKVKKILNQLSYHIEDISPAENRRIPEEKDVKVLTAVRSK